MHNNVIFALLLASNLDSYCNGLILVPVSKCHMYVILFCLKMCCIEDMMVHLMLLFKSVHV